MRRSGVGSIPAAKAAGAAATAARQDAMESAALSLGNGAPSLWRLQLARLRFACGKRQGRRKLSPAFVPKKDAFPARAAVTPSPGGAPHYTAAHRPRRARDPA